MTPFHVQIQCLTFPEPVTAGMNPLVLFSLAYMYRSGNEDAEPILISPDEEVQGLYCITDGRHRVVASMIAGRKTVLALIEKE